LSKNSREIKKKFEAAWDEDVLIILSLEIDENLKQQGLAREFVNRVQKLRKKAGIVPSDPIEAFYKLPEKDPLHQTINNQYEFISKSLGIDVAPLNEKHQLANKIIVGEADVSGSKLELTLCRLAVSFDNESLSKKCPDATFMTDLQSYLLAKDYFHLLNAFKDGKMKVNLNDIMVELLLGQDIFRSAGQKFQGKQSKH